MMNRAQLECALESVEALLESASEKLNDTGDYESKELDDACTLLDKVRIKIDVFKTNVLDK
jgi:hypothetical protein